MNALATFHSPAPVKISDLFAALKQEVGSADLRAALDCIEKVYHAEPEDHWPAARALAVAAEEAIEPFLFD